MAANFKSHVTRLVVTCCLLFGSMTATAQERDGMSREQVIHALKMSIEALNTIDRPEDARNMANLLEEYVGQREMRDRRERERHGEMDRERRNRDEREVGMQHVRDMRIAFEALMEAGKERAADQMEHAIHARQLRLEGARGEEAREIMESAPSRNAEVELLILAADLLKEQGKDDRAHIVQRLADQMRRPREGERDRERFERERDREFAERDRERAAREREGDRSQREMADREVQRRQQEREDARRRIEQEMERSEQMMRELHEVREKMERELIEKMESLERSRIELQEKLEQLERDR